LRIRSAAHASQLPWARRRTPGASPTCDTGRRQPRRTCAREPTVRRRGMPPGREARTGARAPTASPARPAALDRPDAQQHWPCAGRHNSGTPRAPCRRRPRAGRGRTCRSERARIRGPRRRSAGSREAPAPRSAAEGPRKSRGCGRGTSRDGCARRRRAPFRWDAVDGRRGRARPRRAVLSPLVCQRAQQEFPSTCRTSRSGIVDRRRRLGGACPRGRSISMDQ